MTFTSILLVASTLVARTYAVPLNERAPSSDKQVIIQLFEWTWDSIAAECTDFIGPAGYGYVQVSPPAEHVTGDQWWTDYQPVSYTITSKRGNRDQFSSMVATCHAAGVNVIADTILNHMAGTDSGSGVAGSSFTHYDYPGIYQTQDFHHCGLTNGDDIVDYTSQAQVQQYVQGKLADYIDDLLSLGVDGLRLDAAKHIATGDIAAILGQISGSPYITQEVIYGAGEPVGPDQYTANGDVQEFRYTSELQNAFSNGDISGLQDLESKGWISGSSANVFVANHDTERGSSSLNVNSANNAYVLATIFSLAHPYGTPTVLSSYEFGTTDDGAPNGGAGTCSGTGGENGWYCQHRWVAFSGMVGFRNAAEGDLSDWASPASNQIAFGRGATAYVAINNGDSDWTSTFSTSVPDGSYCDVITGSGSDGSCSGTTITVSGGSISATVTARSAIAIHV